MILLYPPRRLSSVFCEFIYILLFCRVYARKSCVYSQIKSETDGFSVFRIVFNAFQLFQQSCWSWINETSPSAPAMSAFSYESVKSHAHILSILALERSYHEHFGNWVLISWAFACITHENAEMKRESKLIFWITAKMLVITNYHCQRAISEPIDQATYATHWPQPWMRLAHLHNQ